jgi:hypothetical protein
LGVTVPCPVLSGHLWGEVRTDGEAAKKGGLDHP